MTPELLDILRQVYHTGRGGFEGLIAALLEDLTGWHFDLATAGSQEGRDMSSRRPNANVVAVECKRYGQDTELNRRELLGELIQAERDIPDLDLWVLVASREVPSQLSEDLNGLAAEKGIGFFTISSGDGAPSSLEVLCARSPETVCTHPGVQAVTEIEPLKTLLHRIAEHPNYQERISALKNSFSSPLVGYENWRVRHNQWFLETLKSDGEARASHGQPINIEEPGVMLIRRAATWRALDEWWQSWSSNHGFLAALGEEGDGKTWGVVSWLSEQIKHTPGFPAVVLLSSTDAPSTEMGATDLRPLLTNVISQRLPGASREQTQRRLDRWLTRPAGQFPLLLLILDGINERGRHDWWRGLLEQLAGVPWRNEVAVIITCRASYWERYFSKLRSVPASSFTVGPYDETELAAALSHQNLRREDIQNSVLPLIRKPRYFDLMVRYHARIAESGDVTVARLIYEDWRDRYERKRAITLSDEEFQNVIRELAQAHKVSPTQLTGQEVTDALPTLSDKQSTLAELQTGGVLQPIKGKYRVNDKLLVYGLGLLLVDQLEQSIASGEDPRETIAGWLEPHAEMDMKAAICEFAALHALSLDSLRQGAKVALLESWVGSHNPTKDAESNLTAYLPIDPQAYVALAESVWSDSYDNRWAQELLTRSFLRWAESPGIAPVILAAFERWLGFVHIKGSPLSRDSAEDAEKAKREIAERIGEVVTPGPLEFAGYPLTVIEDDGQSRLGRVALAVISHLPRKRFIRALTIGCLAEAIMGGADKYELFAWIIRTSAQNIWPELRTEANVLLGVDSVVTRKVARRLLSFEGSAEAQELRETIPNDVSPQSEWYERHQRDPCTSGFAWSAEDCVTCLQREDLPIQWVARHIEPHCVNPDLPVPDSLKAQFSSLTEGIDTQNLWVVLGTTAADHELNTYEPALAAYAPEAFAELIRSTARQITVRRGMARRQLGISLVKHYLILNKEEQEAVRSAWDELVSNADGWGEEEKDAEMFIFKVVLAQLDGDAQLAAVLRRPEEALDLVVYRREFLPMAEWDLVRTQLRNAADAKDVSRILWFLSAHSPTVPHDLLNTSIVPLLERQNNLVRSLVLKLIYGAKEASSINSVVRGGWHWEPSDDGFQNHWGSLILSEYGESLPFDELCRRVSPNYLGYAVMRRGNKQDEVQTYAELIHQLWLRLSTNSPDLPLDLPPFNVESSASGEVQRVSRRSLAEDRSTHTLSFRSPYSTWGGMEEGDDLDLADWNANTAVEHWRRLWGIIQETIEQQRATGNTWFGQNFHEEALDKVVEERPDYLAEWVPDNLSNITIRRSGSFYSALCAVLLKEQAGKGIDLYWRLQEAQDRILIIDHDTQIDLLDFALFDATPDEGLTNAWRRKLERCDTDQELMKIALLAQHGTGGGWLRSYVNEQLGSDVPLDKARALVLSGFLDNQQSLESTQQLLQTQPDTWPGELAKTAEQRRDRNSWAEHWFTRFLTAGDDTTAWASFRLFLRCVDSRFWFWRERVAKEYGTAEVSPQREIFLNCNQESIRSAIGANEKDMEEQFLGQKVMKRQAWPWM
jgi:hypothetical protein